MYSRYLPRPSSIIAFIGKLYPKEKPSKFLPILFNTVWIIKNLIPSIYPLTLISILTVVVQSYYLISHFEKVFFFRYLLFHLVVIVIAIFDFVILLGRNIFDKNCATIKTLLTSISPENENLKSKLNQHILKGSIQKARVWVICMVILQLQCILLNCYYWTLQSEETVLILLILQPIGGNIFRKMWPYFSFWCIFNMIMLFILASIYFIYFSFQNQIALLILTDHVMQVRKKYSKEDQRIMHCFWRRADIMKYEKDIMESLKGIMLMYMEIQRANDQIIDSNQFLHFFFMCGVMVMSIMTILMIFSPYKHAISAGLSNTITLFFIGYVLVDAAEGYGYFGDMFSAAYSDLRWYNWTVKCQKMYLIGTIHFSRGFKLTLFQWIHVNRQLLHKVVKTLYPIANFLNSTRNTGV